MTDTCIDYQCGPVIGGSGIGSASIRNATSSQGVKNMKAMPDRNPIQNMRGPLAAIAVLSMVAQAPGKDNGQWSDSPAAVRQWFQSLMQPDQPYVSCCGEAEAYEADTFEVEGDHYIAIITNGNGVIPEGTRIPVPNNKMKWDAGNPTGHGIIFIGSTGQVYCFVAPGGV